MLSSFGSSLLKLCCLKFRTEIDISFIFSIYFYTIFIHIFDIRTKHVNYSVPSNLLLLSDSYKHGTFPG